MGGSVREESLHIADGSREWKSSLLESENGATGQVQNPSVGSPRDERLRARLHDAAARCSASCSSNSFGASSSDIMESCIRCPPATRGFRKASIVPSRLGYVMGGVVLFVGSGSPSLASWSATHRHRANGSPGG